MKRKLRLVKYHGDLRPGVYTFSGKLIDHLLRSGKAVEHKQEKKIIATKEEKFIPETKVEPRDYSGVPISKLDVTAITTADLKAIADGDVRVTARRMAQEEIDKR